MNAPPSLATTAGRVEIWMAITPAIVPRRTLGSSASYVSSPASDQWPVWLFWAAAAYTYPQCCAFICVPGCTSLLGMEGGAIVESQISASSTHYGILGLQRWGPDLARLNNQGIVNAWTSASHDKNPWIEVRKRPGPRADRYRS